MSSSYLLAVSPRPRLSLKSSSMNKRLLLNVTPPHWLRYRGDLQQRGSGVPRKESLTLKSGLRQKKAANGALRNPSQMVSRSVEKGTRVGIRSCFEKVANSLYSTRLGRVQGNGGAWSFGHPMMDWTGQRPNDCLKVCWGPLKTSLYSWRMGDSLPVPVPSMMGGECIWSGPKMKEHRGRSQDS